MKASCQILATIVWLLISVVSFAQTADSSCLHHIEKHYNIFFPINSSTILSNFLNNSHTIETLRQDMKNTYGSHNNVMFPPDSILIVSTSSPDGSFELNKDLAKRRADSTSKLLKTLFPEINTSNIKIEYLEEDWDGLHQILMTDQDFPQREQMLMIIESSLSANDKEKSLRDCTQGWEYFINNHIYALRNSSIRLTVLGKRDEFTTIHALDSIKAFNLTPIFETPHPDITCNASSINFSRRQKVVAVRTNLLSPLSNVGVEVCINDSWSIEGDYYFPWLCRKDDHQNALQLLSWGVTGRYWFGRNRTYLDRLLGHSIGLGTYMGYYDLEHNYTGHQGEFASMCLDYMYAMPIFKKKMHLELTIGVGYLYSYARPYDVFQSGGKAFREGYTKNIHWVGPLKAGLSLIVPIYSTK